jgi:hypothetical protein
MIVHSEMPSEKSSAIVTASEPLVHGERVIQCVGAKRPIIGRMNSDKCRMHRPMQGTPAIPRRDDVLHDFNSAAPAGARPLMATRGEPPHRKKREAPPGQRQETQMCEVSQ